MENDSPEVYSKVIRAGKRTYFFDVKSTKANDLFVTITESLRNELNGKGNYKKHKIFLYKEDFEKFRDALDEVTGKIAELKTSHPDYLESTEKDFPEVAFEDL